MKYKALFLDVDGTTIENSKDAIPHPRIISAIARASQKLHVCLATGRMLSYVKPIIDHLKLSGLCIITDGTQIYDPRTEKIIFEMPMNHKDVLDSYAILKKYNLRVLINDGQTEYEYYGETPPHKTLALFIPKLKKSQADFIMNELSSISSISSKKGVDWTKNHEYIVICDAKATKLTGIVEVARILEITKEEIIGVGDGYNDFPLLMACGLKIAMGNAVPELKAIADFIAPTVEEDGVAVVIEKFILS